MFGNQIINKLYCILENTESTLQQHNNNKF